MRSAALARLRHTLVVLVGFAICLFAHTGFAVQVPPLQGRINDQANLLSEAVKQQLTASLVEYEKATGHQLAVLTIPTLDGDPIEDFSIRVVEAWKLGKQGKDDGILVLVVSKDRKMRIEVGYGLEGELTDATAGRIVRDVMAPRFRMGDYAGGVAAAVDAVIVKTGGHAAGTAPNDSTRDGLPARPMSLLSRILVGLFKLAFFGLFGVVALFIFFFNRFGGPRSGGMYFGGSGFGGSGGGDGGFSGGGGGFGGGGASGSW